MPHFLILESSHLMDSYSIWILSIDFFSTIGFRSDFNVRLPIIRVSIRVKLLQSASAARHRRGIWFVQSCPHELLLHRRLHAGYGAGIGSEG